MITMIIVGGAGIGLAALAWWAPRAFFGVALLLVMLSAILRALPGTWATLLDELVVVVGLVVLVTRRAVSGRLPAIPPWILWFAGFFAVGLLSSLVNNVPTQIALEGGFLAIKAVLFGLAAAQIDWRPRDLRAFVVGGAWVVVGVFLTSLINLLAPDAWTSFVLGRQVDFPGELGLPSLIGPFEHPAALGRFCAMLAVAIVAYQLSVRAGWISNVLLAMAALPAVLSFRVKSLVSLVLAVVALGALNLRRIPRLIYAIAAVVALVIAVPLVNFAAADFTRYLIDTSARSLLTVGSFDVAARSFPFGAGFGRYGSFTAGVNYSPEYVRLGFEAVFGLRSTPGGGQFLNDTQWPAIIGETGWFGTALFAAGMLHVGIALLRAAPAGEPLAAWLRLTAIGWLVIVVIESIAAPVFTSAPAYPLPFVAAGIYFALCARSSDPSQAGERAAKL